MTNSANSQFHGHIPGQVPKHPSRNFGELFWRAAALYPDKVAIEQGDAALTYAELESRTQRAAAMLRGLGIARGDKVLLLMPNDYRFVESLFGAIRLGAVAVPLNIKLGDDRLAYIARHSDSRALIAHSELADKARAIMDAAPDVEHALVIGGGLRGGLDYDELLAEEDGGFATEHVADDDVAMMMYTSGSTGLPKGCLLSHASKWWTALSGVRSMMHTAADKALVVGPLYHANALWGSLMPMLYEGGSAAILPGFDAVPVIEAIDRYKPTFMSGTPSMYSLMLAEREALRANDVRSIEFLSCGSAPVPAELMSEMRRVFGCEVVETYGLTEAGANVLTPRWGVKKLGSCGLPVKDVQIRVVDLEDESRDCAPDEIGELWSKGPPNTLGYYKQPDVTAEKMTADGWVKSGDLVYADEQGYIYFQGRKDDMINCGGENVYPKEVETILLEHPSVADVSVVSARHQVKGEAPVAWVVLHKGEDADEGALKRFFFTKGPAYAHPRRVFFLDEIPVSGTNKIDRQWLTAEAARRIPDGLSGGMG